MKYLRHQFAILDYIDITSRSASESHWIVNICPPRLSIPLIDRVWTTHIYTLSILAFLDRYGTGTVPLHLSTSVNVSLIPYRSVPTRDPVFCGARSGTNFSGTVWSAQFVMLTGGTVPFRYRHGLDTCGSVPIQTVPEQFVPVRFSSRYGQGNR